MADELKELRTADSQFPHDTVDPAHLPIAPIEKPKLRPHRLTAYEFSGYDSPSVSFGMGRAETAKVLRETADRIESGEYLLQSCGVLSRAEKADYHMTYLTLEFHQKLAEK